MLRKEKIAKMRERRKEKKGKKVKKDKKRLQLKRVQNERGAYVRG